MIQSNWEKRLVFHSGWQSFTTRAPLYHLSLSKPCIELYSSAFFLSVNDEVLESFDKLLHSNHPVEEFVIQQLIQRKVDRNGVLDWCIHSFGLADEASAAFLPLVEYSDVLEALNQALCAECMPTVQNARLSVLLIVLIVANTATRHCCMQKDACFECITQVPECLSTSSQVCFVYTRFVLGGTSWEHRGQPWAALGNAGQPLATLGNRGQHKTTQETSNIP